MLEPESVAPFNLPPRRWATACGLVAAAIGAVVLVAWLAGAKPMVSLALFASLATTAALVGVVLLRRPREERRRAEADRAVREARERLQAERRLQGEREARIATEAELERLRRTDEFRVEFINNAAHELSTPLTPLMLSAASLRRDLGDRDAAERHLGVIQRAVDRLARVVGDMVSAADLQARAIALRRQPLDLAQQLQAAVDLQLPAAAAAGLTLEGPSGPHLTVDADGRRLRSVLGHLLGNAIKFTPPGGRVRVVALRDGDRARVEVRDTGVGLTAQQAEGLWRPYAQAHDKTQRTDSGSGLGLYVTKGIVELHKGEVGVSSPGPGQGSTFWFTLPLAGAALEEPDTGAEPGAYEEEAIELVEEE